MSGFFAAKTNVLTSLQKRAMRIIAKANYLDHTSVIFKKYRIIKLNDLHLFHYCVFLFKLKQNLLPSTCHDFVLVNDINISNYDFRRPNEFIAPLHRTAIRAKSLRVIGPNYWNSLPPDIKSTSVINSFKHMLRSNIVNNYCD